VLSEVFHRVQGCNDVALPKLLTEKSQKLGVEMTEETEQQPPKIEFPCANYPIKIIGDSCDGFVDLVIEVVQRHAPEVDPSAITRRDSSNGRFLTVQVHIHAKGIEQLENINRDLRETGVVRMVL